MSLFPFHLPAKPAETLPGQKTGSAFRTARKARGDRCRPSHLPSLVHVLLLLLLSLVGLYLLTGVGSSKERGTDGPQTVAFVSHTTTFSASAFADGTQSGGGEETTSTATTGRRAAFCLPTDLNCLLNQAAQWVGQQVLAVLQPLINAIDHNPLNFLSQTPPAATYQNATVMQFTNWAIGVVDAAVAVFIVIAGYNVMMARQIGAASYGVMEFLPRLALAVLAANLSLFFIQFFIDLENALCQGVISLFGLTILTNTLVNLFSGNLLGASLLVFVLAVVLGIMNLLLAWQMLVRLALLVLLMVLAPLAFLCWALPQTQGYARLWTSVFTATVFVQFLQVGALALGGMLILYATTINLFNLDHTTLALFTGGAVLYLVLRIPGMLHVYALRPVAEAGPATASAVWGAVESAAGVAVRLIALA
jgi:hypothetical protein